MLEELRHGNPGCPLLITIQPGLARSQGMSFGQVSHHAVCLQDYARGFQSVRDPFLAYCIPNRRIVTQLGASRGC